MAAGMHLKHGHLWILLKEGIAAFIADNALSRGAAIAFYAVTAIAPVLFIATSIAALFMGHAAARGAVGHLRQMMSPESADMVQVAILRVRDMPHSLMGSLLVFCALLFTASGVFAETEDALNHIWKSPRTEHHVYRLVRGRALSLALVIGLGVLLVISMVFATGIAMLGNLMGGQTPVGHVVIGTVNLAVSLALVSLLFAAIYKALPNRRLYWRDVIVGAIGTAILFEAGQALIAFYLSRFVYANIYGAAGGIVVLLIWVYYSVQIFLLGAEFTKVWATHYGSQSEGPLRLSHATAAPDADAPNGKGGLRATGNSPASALRARGGPSQAEKDL